MARRLHETTSRSTQAKAHGRVAGKVSAARLRTRARPPLIGNQESMHFIHNSCRHGNEFESRRLTITRDC